MSNYPVPGFGRWSVMDVYRGLTGFVPIFATGGNTVTNEIIDDILYRIHVFTTVGSSQAFEVQ